MKRIIIFDFNRTLFDPTRGCLFSGTPVVLEALSQQGFDLFLLSHIGSNPKKRKARTQEILQSGIVPYFEDRIILSKEKNTNDICGILQSAAADASSSYVVGDRIKKEIIFGNRAGMQTIWVQNGKFAHEVPTTGQETPNHIITSIKELPNVVR